VSTQDISQASAQLKTSLDGSVQAALQAQLRSDETLLLPLSCQTSTKPDHQPEEEARQVHITVEEACTGYSYNTQAYQSTITQQINQQASTQLGDGYTLVAMVQSQITKTTPKDHNRIVLQMQLTATYAYQFTTEQQQRLKALVTGKSKEEASAILTTFPGVQTVSITIKNNAATLPTNSNTIQVAFLMTGWSA
jgi:hypothetical protein